MYRPADSPIPPPGEFKLPFEGKLSLDNRWVILSELIPWSEFEAEYAGLFSGEMGAPDKSFRMALGALIIKEKLGISDRETVEQIKENPYLQYFIGLGEYCQEPPFDADDASTFSAANQCKLSQQSESTGGEEKTREQLKDLPGELDRGGRNQ